MTITEKQYLLNSKSVKSKIENNCMLYLPGATPKRPVVVVLAPNPVPKLLPKVDAVLVVAGEPKIEVPAGLTPPKILPV